MFLFIFSLHIYGPNYSPEMNMGYRVGEAVRTLALHQCGLIGLDSRSLPFAFVVSSCLAQKVFLRGSTVFFPPEKKIFKFQFNQDRAWPAWEPGKAINILIYPGGEQCFERELNFTETDFLVLGPSKRFVLQKCGLHHNYPCYLETRSLPCSCYMSIRNSLLYHAVLWNTASAQFLMN